MRFDPKKAKKIEIMIPKKLKKKIMKLLFFLLLAQRTYLSWLLIYNDTIFIYTQMKTYIQIL